MEKALKTVAFIPVRGGSKSIPKKNIKLFCGKPLVYWAIAAASNASSIDEIYVSTDDEEIRSVVKGFGLKKVSVIDRSPESAMDSAPSEQALLEFAEQWEFDRVVFIQATSPLIDTYDIEAAIKELNDTRANSLVSVVRQKRFIWEQCGQYARPTNYKLSNRPRRQDWDGYLVENGAIYITHRQDLLNSRCRLSGNIAVYVMSDETYYELDDPADWIILENLKRNVNQPSMSAVPKEINLLISDVDGVLTDAGMYYSTDGHELKKFNTRDGKGIELVRKSGIKVMLLTAEDIEVVRARGEKLKADYVFMGIKDKHSFLESFFEKHPEHSFGSTAYIGDDINDLECLKRAKFSAAPVDAHSLILQTVDYVCSTRGGGGCVRELCDLLINDWIR
jgi:3-deoxy-D-manno-octulosonate 8-phosphate phosphatase, YrbI family